MMDKLIESILTLGVWSFQIGTVLLAGLIMWYMVRRIANKMGKKTWSKLVCILLVLCFTVCLAAKPPLAGSPDLEMPLEEMPEELREEIISLNSGLYTLRLPLIPVRIEVLEFDGERVLVRTCYFPAGTVEREHGPDGPSITKPLN